MFNNLKQILPNLIYSSSLYFDNNILIILLKDLENSLLFLKKHTDCRFLILSDIYAIDNLFMRKRFIIMYNLLSIQYNIRLQVQVFIDEFNIIPSIYKIYRCSNWYEREIYDMFGIFFFNHPDLRRLLTDYGYKHYPLRKDFPLTGFFEIVYNDKLKLIINKNLELSQKFRIYHYNNIWK